MAKYVLVEIEQDLPKETLKCLLERVRYAHPNIDGVSLVEDDGFGHIVPAEE